MKIENEIGSIRVEEVSLNCSRALRCVTDGLRSEVSGTCCVSAIRVDVCVRYCC